MSSNYKTEKKIFLIILIIFFLFVIKFNLEKKNIPEDIVKLIKYSEPDIIETVEIKGIPHFLQKPDYCGEACIKMYLKKLGIEMTQDEIFEKSGLDKNCGRGCYTPELVNALKNLKFKPGIVWYGIRASDADEDLEKIWWDLYGHLKKEIPSIICMHYDDEPETTEHFRLITGYDKIKDEIIYNEPAEENGKSRRMKRKMLFKLWPLKYQKKTWLIVYMPLVYEEK